MSDCEDSFSFSNVRRLSSGEFKKLSKKQLIIALKDAVDHADFLENSQCPPLRSTDQQMLRSIVNEAVSEIRKELLTESKRLISEMELNVYDKLQHVSGNISDIQEHMENRIISEMESREMRKNNAMFFGVCESKSDARDKTVITDILSAAGVSPDIKVKRCFRVGANGVKNRPIKVIFHSLDDKMSVLKNAANLRHLHRDNIHRRVFIKADLTPLQLKKEKVLRAELKTRRDNGENVIIKHGKVIPGILRRDT